jgi:DNA-binding CsgD family transcriptional regulator
MEPLSEIIKKRLTPGVLIFDINNRLLYFNKAAFEMIPELKNIAQSGEIKNHIIEDIHKLCNQVKSSADAINYKVLNNIPGPPISLRALLIGGHEDISTTHIMVLIERIIEKRKVDFEKVKRDFKLTRRELEVVVLLCQGLSNKEISEKIFISEYTVKDHIKKIMRKMGVNSRSEIIASLK